MDKGLERLAQQVKAEESSTKEKMLSTLKDITDVEAVKLAEMIN
jgi:hypothetical protein